MQHVNTVIVFDMNISTMFNQNLARVDIAFERGVVQSGKTIVIIFNINPVSDLLIS